MLERGHAQRKSAGIAQVDVFEPAIDAAQCLRVDGDEARQPLQHRLFDLIAPQLEPLFRKPYPRVLYVAAHSDRRIDAQVVVFSALFNYQILDMASHG